MEEESRDLAAFWTQRSVFCFYDHRRSDHMIRCALDETGTTPRELHSLALGETKERFRKDPLVPSEEWVAEAVEAGLAGDLDA